MRSLSYPRGIGRREMQQIELDMMWLSRAEDARDMGCLALRLSCRVHARRKGKAHRAATSATLVHHTSMLDNGRS